MGSRCSLILDSEIPGRFATIVSSHLKLSILSASCKTLEKEPIDLNFQRVTHILGKKLGVLQEAHLFPKSRPQFTGDLFI